MLIRNDVFISHYIILLFTFTHHLVPLSPIYFPEWHTHFITMGRPQTLTSYMYFPYSPTLLFTYTHTYTFLCLTPYVFLPRGADLAALVREASINALKEIMSLSLSSLSYLGGPSRSMCTETLSGPSPMVQQRHFDDAFKRVLPSVDIVSRKY